MTRPELRPNSPARPIGSPEDAELIPEASLAKRPSSGRQTDDVSHDAPRFETGTTIVALRATDGVMMAADQRMSLGGQFTANKDVQKIEQVHPTATMAIAGSVGPAQDLIQSLRAEASLYESRRDEPMSMTALSNAAGEHVRGLPVAPLLAGVDESGGHVFELDGGGSVVGDSYAAGGSGMQVAYGVLERRVDADADVEAAADTAVAAVEAACERDTASGDGVTLTTVTADGVAFDERRAS
ncbi:proteasome endopeptidase complex, beta component Threonine peptidase. MEROPS family T01A [Halomicrobium zhouii]|uniref:proteasome endopeptidase complex n=1 Tax=Halomicrobium zhouii TaxID=767519 RepID=A0A1I6LYE1_9EURY|nr:proteasome endopeptidase complex, beta component Threonine peptidase. MEROPS family T01A [Halomicrobium zhouii]